MIIRSLKILYFIYFLLLFYLVLVSCAENGIANSEINDEDGLFGSLLNRLERRMAQAMYHEPEEVWPGRWFPDKEESLSRHRPPVGSLPSVPPFPTKEQQHLNQIFGMITPACDDGKTNLTIDWDESISDYLCLQPKTMRFIPDADIPTIEKEDLIPKKYSAGHICMDKEIHYPPGLITFGSHRAAWPQYGEYLYVPPQRWLHNLEHGAVVMLYHPCAHPFVVNQLRKLVSSCLYRHIVTPSKLLSPQRPLALLTWGWSLTMSDVTPEYVIKFIKDHALKGPEQIYLGGKFSANLVKPAKLISDEQDTRLCPNINVM